jgi:hypothetical protein
MCNRRGPSRRRPAPESNQHKKLNLERNRRYPVSSGPLA